MMDYDEIQRASEDIELIKNVLQRTTVSFSTLQPAFLGLAMLWLIYALLETGIWIGTLFTTSGTPVSLLLSACSLALQWLFCAALLAFTAVWRKRLPATGVDPLASRLAGMWGVMIIGYVGSRVLELAVFPAVFRFSNIAIAGEMGVSGLEFTLCNQALYYATTITFATLPLLLTAVFFRSRSVALLGIGALVLGLVWSVTWIFAINNRVPDVVRDVGGVLYRLLQFLPPIALILFSSILRKHNITNITVLRRKKP